MVYIESYLNHPCCLCAPDQTAGGWKADGLSGFLPDMSLIKVVAAGTSKSMKLRKRNRSQSGKVREHKESPKLGPCHCGMLRLQRKTKEWREKRFSPKYALDVLYTSCTQFQPHLFFSIILSHNTSMCTQLLLTISLSLGSYSPTCYSGLSNRPQPLSLTSAAGAPYLTSLRLPHFVLHVSPCFLLFLPHAFSCSQTQRAAWTSVASCCRAHQAAQQLSTGVATKAVHWSLAPRDPALDIIKTRLDRVLGNLL